MRPAIDCALNLYANPSLVRAYQQRNLPPDMHQLLQAATGLGSGAYDAAGSGASSTHLEEAASFFIEQVLLDQESDSFRVLGCGRDASYQDLRRNMALLMHWLHPDSLPAMRGATGRGVFATRVTRAWNDLKSDERRNAYVQALASPSYALPALVKPSKRRESIRAIAVSRRQPLTLSAWGLGYLLTGFSKLFRGRS